MTTLSENGRGTVVAAGQLGENPTTRGIPLLELSAGARLRLERDAVIELMGLRTPALEAV